MLNQHWWTTNSRFNLSIYQSEEIIDRCWNLNNNSRCLVSINKRLCCLPVRLSDWNKLIDKISRILYLYIWHIRTSKHIQSSSISVNDRLLFGIHASAIIKETYINKCFSIFSIWWIWSMEQYDHMCLCYACVILSTKC